MFTHLDITGTDGTRIIATWMGGYWRVRQITTEDNILYEEVTNRDLAQMLSPILPHHFLESFTVPRGPTCGIDPAAR